MYIQFFYIKTGCLNSINDEMEIKKKLCFYFGYLFCLLMISDDFNIGNTFWQYGNGSIHQSHPWYCQSLHVTI